jgi:hypothetical protein
MGRKDKRTDEKQEWLIFRSTRQCPKHLDCIDFLKALYFRLFCSKHLGYIAF